MATRGANRTRPHRKVLSHAELRAKLKKHNHGAHNPAHPLKVERWRLGWSMADLTSMSGVRSSTICDIEQWKRLPQRGTLEDLAAAMGLDSWRVIDPEFGSGAVFEKWLQTRLAYLGFTKENPAPSWRVKRLREHVDVGEPAARFRARARVGRRAPKLSPPEAAVADAPTVKDLAVGLTGFPESAARQKPGPKPAPERAPGAAPKRASKSAASTTRAADALDAVAVDEGSSEPRWLTDDELQAKLASMGHHAGNPPSMLRVERVRRRILGPELATRADTTPQIISAIELGDRVPSQDLALRIAKALGLEADEPGLAKRLAEPTTMNMDPSRAPALDFGGRVRALRHEHGWEVKELAEASSLHEGHIRNLEARRRPPRRITVLRLAEAFGIEPDVLWENSAASREPSRVAALRQLRGWTVGELSKRSRVPRLTIRFLEEGLKAPGVDELSDLAQALQVSPDEIWSAPDARVPARSTR